ncbi:MAG: acetylxylan esterase [Deltaproteobacteria bacterium]|nr:acetylxylan esterase [Deltaproteobacteria bacterium]
MFTSARRCVPAVVCSLLVFFPAPGCGGGSIPAGDAGDGEGIAADDGEDGDSTGDDASEAGDDVSPPDTSDDGDDVPDDGGPCLDGDGDGFPAGPGCPAPQDCDDSIAAVHPGRDEIPFNDRDDDCNPSTSDSQVFDLAVLGDGTAAGCAFGAEREVLSGGRRVFVQDVSYLSFESIDAELHPIVIRGYFARPAAVAEPMPGVVVAHGLGGFATESTAADHAVRIGVATLAYTGPGGAPPAGEEGAASEGLPASDHDGYRMFDTLADVRGSWFWGHAAAAMRGLTCLADHPAVDETRLGITGFSAGGVVSFLASGVDDRLSAAVPVSGMGSWEVAARSPDAWQHALLAGAGLTVASPEWLRLIERLVTADAMIGGAPTSGIFLVDGTTDEFFPLTAAEATLAAVPTERRVSFAANYDHGCYSVTGLEDAATIEARAALRVDGAQRVWFRHVFGTDTVYAEIPDPPQVTDLVSSADPATCLAACGLPAPCLAAVASVDPGNASLEVEAVRFWWSQDAAVLWVGQDLARDSGTGLWTACLPVAFDPSAVPYYVDAQYVTPLLVRFPQERFSLSSDATIPAGFVPTIRGITDCMP